MNFYYVSGSKSTANPACSYKHPLNAKEHNLCLNNEIGPVKITADLDPSKQMVALQVIDLGCGMDEGTLRKAIQPFYSAKTAGRKRGMGLAYAARFAQINGGSLQIESHPGVGTTVVILLPCA